MILFMVIKYYVSVFLFIINSVDTSTILTTVTKVRQHDYLTQTGLIFYNIKTNRTLLPPIVTSEKYSLLKLPQIGLPCSCESLNCGCCAGLFQQQFNQHCKFSSIEKNDSFITHIFQFFRLYKFHLQPK